MMTSLLYSDSQRYQSDSDDDSNDYYYMRSRHLGTHTHTHTHTDRQTARQRDGITDVQAVYRSVTV